MRRLLPLLSAGAVAVGLIVAPAAAAKKTTTAPLPAERPYPTVLDAPIEYEGMTTCDPTARPGALLLRQLLLDTYGEAVIGISRACDQDTISEHKEGRAVDWMIDWKNPEEFTQAQAFVDWVTAPGPDGTPAANARRLGIMYIGWADKMWRAYDTKRGWTELKGCFSLQGSANDTFCHRDHVHFSMTWDGAAARTSYWDGTAVLDTACPVTRATGSPRSLGASSSFIPIKPVRMFDSRKKGEHGCYLQQRRWSGDDRSVPVKVAGRKGVPADAQAVAVRVTAYSSNAPGWLNAGSAPGSGGPKVVSLGMDGSSASTAIVPVSDSGNIWLSTVAGHAQVSVDVLGYFGRATQAATKSASGTWLPVPTKLAATATIPADGAQTVKIEGAPKNLAGVSMTVNTSGTADGHIRVTPPGVTTKADAVDVTKGQRSGAVFAASSDGSITLTNTAKAPSVVNLLLTGWISKPSDQAGRLVPVSRDLGTFNTAKTVQVISGKVPAGAKAVVLSVTTKGATKGGGVIVWGDGERPVGRSVDVRAGRTNTDLVVVAPAADGSLRLAGSAAKGTASVRMVGVIK